MTTGRTRDTKGKKLFASGERENHENMGTTAQTPAARLRFWGPSPTKTDPSGSCLMSLAHYCCSFGKKWVVRWAARIYAKYGKKYAKKLPNWMQIM